MNLKSNQSSQLNQGNQPILSTLTDAQREQLFAWCEQYNYSDVSRLLAKPLAEGGFNIFVSASTLSRFYSTYNIADTNARRTELLQAAGIDTSTTPPPADALLHASEEQLQLRLLELSAGPMPTVQELRALFQIITRLRALQLSERRVKVAESRETRLAAAQAASAEPQRGFTFEETCEGLDAMLFGKCPA
jgi:hypothetical protein